MAVKDKWVCSVSASGDQARKMTVFLLTVWERGWTICRWRHSVCYLGVLGVRPGSLEDILFYKNDRSREVMSVLPDPIRPLPGVAAARFCRSPCPAPERLFLGMSPQRSSSPPCYCDRSASSGENGRRYWVNIPAREPYQARDSDISIALCNMAARAAAPCYVCCSNRRLRARDVPAWKPRGCHANIP